MRHCCGTPGTNFTKSFLLLIWSRLSVHELGFYICHVVMFVYFLKLVEKKLLVLQILHGKVSSPLQPGNVNAGKSSFCMLNPWLCCTTAFTATPCFFRAAATPPSAQRFQTSGRILHSSELCWLVLPLSLADKLLICQSNSVSSWTTWVV